MSRKQTAKPYWEMTLDELREATKEFDQEFIADKSRPLSPEELALWKKIRAKSSRAANGRPKMMIAVRLEKELLNRCTTLAKKKRISRDVLIARGLRAVLAAEGEA
jgi:hypothetical protein